MEGLEAAAAQQQKEIGALTAALKAQAAQVQKASDQLTEQLLFLMGWPIIEILPT